MIEHFHWQEPSTTVRKKELWTAPSCCQQQDQHLGELITVYEDFLHDENE